MQGPYTTNHKSGWIGQMHHILYKSLQHQFPQPQQTNTNLQAMDAISRDGA